MRIKPIISMMLLAGVVLAAGSGCSEKHEHSYEWYTAKEATCTENGVKEYRCTCGDVAESETIAATGHTASEEWTVVSEPSCTECGTEAILCTVCGEAIETRETEFPGHTPGDETVIFKEPTCEEDGYKANTCTVCGAEIEGTGRIMEVIPATGHTWGDWVVDEAPTCTQTGKRHRTCSVCGKTEEKSISRLSHEFGEYETTTEPTCTTAGVETKVCSVCGREMTNELAALGHNWSSWTVTKAATCSTAGTQTRKCANCGETETATIAATGNHSYGSWTVTKEATTSSAGAKVRKCSTCGYTETIAIPKIEAQTVSYTLYYDGVKIGSGASDGCVISTTNYETISIGSSSVNYVPTSEIYIPLDLFTKYFKTSNITETYPSLNVSDCIATIEKKAVTMNGIKMVNSQAIRELCDLNISVDYWALSSNVYIWSPEVVTLKDGTQEIWECNFTTRIHNDIDKGFNGSTPSEETLASWEEEDDGFTRDTYTGGYHCTKDGNYGVTIYAASSGSVTFAVPDNEADWYLSNIRRYNNANHFLVVDIVLGGDYGGSKMEDSELTEQLLIFRNWIDVFYPTCGKKVYDYAFEAMKNNFQLNVLKDGYYDGYQLFDWGDNRLVVMDYFGRCEAAKISLCITPNNGCLDRYKAKFESTGDVDRYLKCENHVKFFGSVSYKELLKYRAGDSWDYKLRQKLGISTEVTNELLERLYDIALERFIEDMNERIGVDKMPQHLAKFGYNNLEEMFRKDVGLDMYGTNKY